MNGIVCWLLLWAGAGAVQAALGPVIDEIHYAPDKKTEWVEFVELYNPTAQAIDLSGWALTEAVKFTFPVGAILPAGSYLTVAQDVNAVQLKFPLANVNPGATYGPFQGKLSNEGETLVLLDATGQRIDEVDYQLGFPWPTVGDSFEGHGQSFSYSIQLIHPSLENDIGGHWRAGAPSPNFMNFEVFSDNAPPAVRRVRMEPEQPQPHEPVWVTARITDVNGVEAVNLLYQVVAPGAYKHKQDAEFWEDWTPIPMVDSGEGGDKVAGDTTYTAMLPADLQQHRHLVRFRIEAVDGVGTQGIVPDRFDPQPNFAYFVYQGVPFWSGAVQPGVDEPVFFDTPVLTSVPVYHLISKREDVEASTWLEKYSGSDYKWYGTLVVDGQVYDHIRYRARGGVWRYAMGKNMWKFDFNRGHSLQARDDYGKKYDTTWDNLNLSACIQQGSFRHRGEQGMYEAVGFKMFNLLGVAAPKTHWLHFRIIDDVEETGANQYEGDFWGLYLAIEQMDGRFLDEHGLPDGNLYKIQSHDVEERQASNLGPYGPDNFADFYALRQGYRSSPNPTEEWWRANVDLPGYYSYRAVVEGIHHGDIGYGKNYYFYFNPETQLASQLPWDLDLTWAEHMYGNGQDPFYKEGAIFSQPALQIEYQNRLREFVDLFYNTDQAWQLIDEFAALIDDPNGGPSMVDADRAMWDYHWVLGDAAYPQYLSRPASNKAGQGKFYEAVPTRDFPGMVKWMKDYIVYVTTQTRRWAGGSGPSLLALMVDAQVPQTPTIQYTGTTEFAVNDLRFSTSDFNDPQGADTFTALQWRLGEVESFSQAAEPPSPQPDSTDQVLIETDQQWFYHKGTHEPIGSSGAWRLPGYTALDNGSWQTGQAPIGYGESFVETVLSDMRYNYTTVYLRKDFTVTEPGSIDQVTLHARYDDGFVAWINGIPIHAQNVPGWDLPFNATALGNDEQQNLRTFTIDLPPNALLPGINTLAVHLVNLSLTSSSDCFFDARLVGESATTGPTEEPPVTTSTPGYVVQDRPGYYEINTLWSSGEITEFQPDVVIPAAVVKEGHTYRVRCRMKDNSGRWSHWSAPVQFAVKASAPQGLRASLRVTELMYNPLDGADGSNWDNDDFEYIELRNTTNQSISLSGLRFDKGIQFDFSQAERTELAPDEVCLLVSRRDAFTERYGAQAAAKIIGQYEAKLSNGGERLRLVDFQEGVLFDVTYDDAWYPETDGQGYALEPVTLETALGDTMASKDYWQSGTQQGGTPGQ